MLLTIILISITATVYINILSQEKILNWWFMFGLRFEDKFFYKPIWACEKCFAGQLAFWYCILFLIDFKNAQSYFDMIFFVSTAIGITHLINKYIEW